ncbi:PadR family transcriptional regulator [Paenibacillus flagellatus]|uniref:PadR family transcriptional regulator n=1 Tax=Paenibacillus flagellatus TaxID=2211139 RepID=A0A2V5KD62_9BACL|nr:PadR family transcriptional regulator [Paenibacillus flagellatus]PYI51820.1 PadR family transcriptional regulator [Paenibacillus flagellatus]
MNTLSYGLLSLLSLKPCSGYDLMHQFELFWPAKHSQIYPLLSAMEKEGLVSFELVSQSDKPDKKVYTITDRGTAALKEWLEGPTGEPVMKDEMLLKTYCLWNTSPENALRMFGEREKLYEEKLGRLEAKVRMLEQVANGDPDNLEFRSHYFGIYMLLNKALSNTRSNLEWCRWARAAIGKRIHEGGG